MGRGRVKTLWVAEAAPESVFLRFVLFLSVQLCA